MTKKNQLRLSSDVALKVAREAASKAAQVIVEARLKASFKIEQKEDCSLVTTADREAERVIVEQIHEHFPGHSILAEESSAEYEDADRLLGPLWIIDPIDGTTNFAHGHAHVGISIAYAEEGVVQAAVVLAPFLHQEYTATKGGGAFCNGERISASPLKNLKQALVATGMVARQIEGEESRHRFSKFIFKVHDLRRLGAASVDVCWVACGKLHGYFESVKPWDIAAAGLIGREAGARQANFLISEKDKKLPKDLRCQNYLIAAPGVFADMEDILSGTEK